jgi:hypothetical protein
MKDWRGTEIEVNSTIVYAVKESTSVRLVEATVLEINYEEHAWRTEQVPVFKVQPIRETGWRGGTEMRPRTIRAIENITVIPDEHKPTMTSVMGAAAGPPVTIHWDTPPKESPLSMADIRGRYEY